MIKLQVNHSQHTPLRSTILIKELSETTQQTQHDSDTLNQQCKSQSSHKESVHPSKSQSIDKESDVISQIRATGSKVKRDLEELINQYKSEAEKMMVNNGYDPEKEASIREHLRKLQQEKKERRLKMERDLARLESKKEALQNTSDQNLEETEQRRKSIEQRIFRIKEREKRRHESEQEFLKFYDEYKLSKPKYKVMQEEFIKQQERTKEQKLRAFKQRIEQTYQPMNLKQLEEFQDDYLSRKNQAEKIRLRNHLQDRKREEANSARLNQLYKGHCHSNIMRELEERQSKTNDSYEKSKRIREYGELVREQYKPRTIKSSLDDELNESQNGSALPQTERGKRVIKERYLHGEYLGKKIQYEKIPLTHSEHINKGVSYLQFLKKLPKKPKEKTQTSTIIPQRKRTISSVYKVQRQYNPLYRGKIYNSIDFTTLDDRQSVNRMINVMKHRSKQIQLQQTVLKNRTYEDRQDFLSAQRSYNNNLISNIQSKLSILKKL